MIIRPATAEKRNDRRASFPTRPTLERPWNRYVAWLDGWNLVFPAVGTIFGPRPMDLEWKACGVDSVFISVCRSRCLAGRVRFRSAAVDRWEETKVLQVFTLWFCETCYGTAATMDPCAVLVFSDLLRSTSFPTYRRVPATVRRPVCSVPFRVSSSTAVFRNRCSPGRAGVRPDCVYVHFDYGDLPSDGWELDRCGREPGRVQLRRGRASWWWIRWRSACCRA